MTKSPELGPASGLSSSAAAAAAVVVLLSFVVDDGMVDANRMKATVCLLEDVDENAQIVALLDDLCDLWD
jgi:shikimate kinase